MNILQQQNSAKELSDQQLQQELLNPTGALPSYLALSELQRRKDMRSSYQSLQGKPGSSMAEEFARGLGGADVGKYGEAVRGAMPSSPGGEQPPMPMQAPMQPPMQPPMQAPMQPPMQPPMQDPMQQQFAEGGSVDTDRPSDAYFSDLGIGSYRPLNAESLIRSGAMRVTQPGNGRDGGFDTSDDPDIWSLVSHANDTAQDSQTRKWPDKPSSYESASRSLNEPGALYDGKYRQLIWSAKQRGMTDKDIYLPSERHQPRTAYAEGGAIMAPGATKAVGASMATVGNNNNQNNGNSPPWPRKDEKDILGGFKKEDGSFNPAALGPLVGILAGQSVGDSFKGFANSMMGPVPRLFGFKGFADGGPVGSDNGGGIYATKAALAPSGALPGPMTIEDILKGIGITNQKLGIAGASNMNPYKSVSYIDTFGGADSGGPGTGNASDSGTSSSNSAATDGTAADASAASAGAASAGNSGDDGTGGGTGATYYRGGVVGLRGGGDPGSFYRDFSDRREDNRVDYLDMIRERMKQSAPRGGMPPINPYGTSNPYVATAVDGGPYGLDENVAATVSKLADQDRWSNPRGNYFPGHNFYSKFYGTRPGPTPTPMGIGEYPKAAVGEPAPPITYDYPDPSAEGPRASGGLRDAARNREAIRNTVMLDSLPNSEPPPAVNAFSFLPPQSTYVPFNPNNPEPALSNPNGDVDEGGFAPGKGPVVPGAQPPPSSRRPTSPPGGGSPNARGPSGDAGGGGGGSPNGGIGTALNPDLDGFVGQVRGLQLPDRFGEIEARNQQEREDLKSGRESDKGLAMLKAGMTMAGGTSSNALSNISAGVTAGISEWSAAEKEFRVANQAIRSAENAIQIARANRDERQLEMAVKVKMHFEQIREQAAARREAAGAAAGARADAREDRALDRAENRVLKDTQLAISDVNSITAEIKYIQQSLNSLTLDEGTRKSLESERNDRMAELKVARGRLGRLQGARDENSGVSARLDTTKPPGPVIGHYVPGKGFVPAS